MNDLHRALCRRLRGHRKMYNAARGTAQRFATESRQKTRALSSALGRNPGAGPDFDVLTAGVLRLRADLAEARLELRRLRAELETVHGR